MRGPNDPHPGVVRYLLLHVVLTLGAGFLAVLVVTVQEMLR